MHDALGMRVLERFRDIDTESRDCGDVRRGCERRQGTRLAVALSSLQLDLHGHVVTGHVLHREVARGLGAAFVEHPDDVRVRELARAPYLTLETLDLLSGHRCRF